MNIQNALRVLIQWNPIVVRGKTFQPTEVQDVHLLTGEHEYWIRGEDHFWLSIDVDSDAVRLFEDIEEQLEPSEETISFNGEDYEFSLEGGGEVLDEEGNQIDLIEFREYESSRGEILRVTKFEVTEDTLDVAFGIIITEEDLQKT